MMRAQVGDWLVVPPGPHGRHTRRGQIVGLVHPDGSPPYRVRWLDDDHVTLVFPPPEAQVVDHLEHSPTPLAPTGAPEAPGA